MFTVTSDQFNASLVLFVIFFICISLNITHLYIHSITYYIYSINNTYKIQFKHEQTAKNNNNSLFPGRLNQFDFPSIDLLPRQLLHGIF